MRRATALLVALAVLAGATRARAQRHPQMWPPEPPAECAATNASDPFLHHATAVFDANNADCYTQVNACLNDNATACERHCDADAGALRDACYADAGAVLCGVDGRQASAGGGLPAFDVHTLACVPSTCGPALHDAYELFWRQRLCGELVNTSACARLALTCGYASPDGDLWTVAIWTSVVGAVLFGACGAGYCYTRRKQLEEEEGEEEGGFYVVGELGDDAQLVAVPRAGAQELPELDDPSAALVLEDPTAAYTWAQRPQDPAHR